MLPKESICLRNFLFSTCLFKVMTQSRTEFALNEEKLFWKNFCCKGSLRTCRFAFKVVVSIEYLT